MNIAMLGSGFIARFYADALCAQRGRDALISVYSRNIDKARKFAEDYKLSFFAADMDEVVSREDVDVVIISLPNNLHEAAVAACAKAKKHVLCTKPLGRTAAEAKRMLEMVEKAGIMGGYLEDLCYTPKFMKSLKAVKEGSIGRVLYAKSREAHPGPHSDWFWDSDQSGGGAIVDLGCHCIEIARNFIGKDVRPVEVMCWAATQVHPIKAEDNAIGLIKYANGAVGQFEVSWCFRGGMDLRDEVMGTEGTIWLNGFLRTGFEMFTTGQGGYVAEKAEIRNGWLFPVGDEVHELGYTNMFTDMFNAIEEKRQPLESFYDGYIVNAIIDAAYKSAQTARWEPVLIEGWRGTEEQITVDNTHLYDDDHYLIKRELLPSGEFKLILKHRVSGQIIIRDEQV